MKTPRTRTTKKKAAAPCSRSDRSAAAALIKAEAIRAIAAEDARKQAADVAEAEDVRLKLAQARYRERLAEDIRAEREADEYTARPWYRKLFGR
jgi:hypothetical protein